MKKGAIGITIKSLFAVFLVIFVVLIAIASLRSRTEILEQKQRFDYYELTDNFLLSFLSNPACLTVGDYYNESKQVPAQGLLDFYKLNKTQRKNSDLSCTENFYFLYSVEVNDLKNKKSWFIGIDTKDYSWVERKIRTSLPVAIMYDRTNVNLGEAILNAYIGEIPLFYGTIKKVCNTKQDESYSLTTNYVISYNNNQNQFCVGKDCFYAYFICEVTSFNIPKGEHIIYISYKNDSIKVVV